MNLENLWSQPDQSVALNDTIGDVFANAITTADANTTATVNANTTGSDLAALAAELIRVLNIDSTDFIESICKPAFKAYTYDVLADIANDERVKVETELYGLVKDLFYQVRAGTADLSAFFYAVLGRNL